MHSGGSHIRTHIIRRLLKLTLFFGIIFLLLFCIAWQNVHVTNLNGRIEQITVLRTDLEKKLYLKNMELSYLKSRERIRDIAEGEFGMQPVTCNDVRIIVY